MEELLWAVAEGADQQHAESEWFGELGNRPSVVAPVHKVVTFPPAELSSPLTKTQTLLIETEFRDAVNLGWYKTAVKVHEFKSVDDRIDSVV